MIYLIKKTFTNKEGNEIIYFKYYVKIDSYYIEVKITDYFAKQVVKKYALENDLVYDKISDIDQCS